MGKVNRQKGGGCPKGHCSGQQAAGLIYLGGILLVSSLLNGQSFDLYR